MSDTARSLLEELVNELGPDVPGEEGTVPRALERRIRAALDDTPEGLNVERLARALENVEGLDPEYGDDERLYLAHQIAANLRLSDTGDSV